MEESGYCSGQIRSKGMLSWIAERDAEEMRKWQEECKRREEENRRWARAREEYRQQLYRQENSREAFLRSTGYVAADHRSSISSQELYQQYLRWCDDYDVTPLPPRALTVHLKKNSGKYRVVPVQNIPTPQGTHVRGFRGLRVWEERDAAADHTDNTHNIQFW